MFVLGAKDFDRNGKESSTALFAGSAIKDSEFKTTRNGKELGEVSVKAYNRKDGTAAFLTVKGWGPLARQVASLSKGDRFLAAGRLESREYNGKTYTDLVADFIIPAGGEAKTGSFPLPPGSAVDVPADDFSELENPGELPF